MTDIVPKLYKEALRFLEEGIEPTRAEMNRARMLAKAADEIERLCASELALKEEAQAMLATLTEQTAMLANQAAAIQRLGASERALKETLLDITGLLIAADIKDDWRTETDFKRYEAIIQQMESEINGGG